MVKMYSSDENCARIFDKLIAEYGGSIKGHELFMMHCSMTGDIAEEASLDAIRNYPDMAGMLIPEEMRTAGYFHDVGRVLTKNQAFHELRGANLIEERGLELGIASSHEALQRIAQTARSHFVVSEQFSMEEYIEDRMEFEDTDTGLIVPKTWNEAIIIYADLRNAAGKRMSFRKRIDSFKKRYEHDPIVKALETGGEGRLEKITSSVDNLKQGRLSQEELEIYDFLI